MLSLPSAAAEDFGAVAAEFVAVGASPGHGHDQGQRGAGHERAGAGILREQAPPPLDGRTGVDAVVVSTENELT
jgi:hypothetical protein